MKLPKLILLYLVGGMVACVIVVLGFYVLGSNPSYDLPIAQSNAKELPTQALDGQDIPAYPDARQVSLSPNEAREGRAAFETDDSPDVVMEFYERNLIEKGWSLYERASSLDRIYVRDNSKEHMPYRSLVRISISKYQGAGPEPTSIYVFVGREPDPNNIPIYKNVQQVEQKDELITVTILGGSTRVMERKVIYVSSATPQEVEAYYKTMLPQYGWILRDGTNTDTSIGITYGYGEGRSPGGSVSILTKTSTSGQTMVEMRMRGDLVKNWDPWNVP